MPYGRCLWRAVLGYEALNWLACLLNIRDWVKEKNQSRYAAVMHIMAQNSFGGAENIIRCFHWFASLGRYPGRSTVGASIFLANSL